MAKVGRMPIAIVMLKLFDSVAVRDASIMWASALVSLAPMRRLTFPDQQQTQQVMYKTNVTGALKERGTAAGHTG